MTNPTITDADLIAIGRAHYRSLYEFVKGAWMVLEPGTDLVDGWHIRALCEGLEAVSRGEVTRLAISIPPRFMKSMIVSVLWPAWEWTHSPHLRFLTTSASEEFCERDTGKMMSLVKSEWYQFYWPTQLTTQNIKKFQNTRFGERAIKSFTSITGTAGNRIIIDDPLPVAWADSDVERGKVTKTFFESVTSRVSQESDAIVIIMQRVHEDDLIGEIQQRQERGEDLGFEFLTIPMEYEGDAHRTSWGYRDPRRKIGELILPPYRSKKWCEREKISMGAYAWNAQYQQQPTPRGDGFFKTEHFNRYARNQLPERLNYYLTSDHANGGRDYNVFRIWGLDEAKNYWLVDSFRKRCTIQEALGIELKDGRYSIKPQGAFALIRTYKPRRWYADHDNIISSNRMLIQDAMIQTGVMVPLELITQGKRGASSKTDRASAYQSLATLGKIYLPVGAVGDTALAEYQAFSPNCRHDDQVDADSLLPRLNAQGAMSAQSGTARKKDDYIVANDEGDDGYDAIHCY